MNELDPRLIRLATRRFYELQGLRQVVLAAGSLAPAYAWVTTASEPWTWVAFLSALAVCLPIGVVLDRYYRRFGRVAQPRRTIWTAMGVVYAIQFGLPSQGHLLPAVPNLVWLAVAAYAVRTAWDGRPFRWHHLLVAAGATYVAFGSIGAIPGTFGWMAPRAWAVVEATIICGLLDHRLFLAVMRGARRLPQETP